MICPYAPTMLVAENGQHEGPMGSPQKNDPCPTNFLRCHHESQRTQ